MVYYLLWLVAIALILFGILLLSSMEIKISDPNNSSLVLMAFSLTLLMSIPLILGLSLVVGLLFISPQSERNSNKV
jgi:hypothetical protein